MSNIKYLKKILNDKRRRFVVCIAHSKPMGLCVIHLISRKKLKKNKFVVLSSFILNLFLQNSTRIFLEKLFCILAKVSEGTYT